jgi:hypothetical protein
MRARILSPAARLYPHKADALQAKEARGQIAITCPFPFLAPPCNSVTIPLPNKRTKKTVSLKQ